MKKINRIVRWVNYITVVLVLIMMLLVVADVYMRDAFNSPITGTAEITALIMVSLVLGVAWCAVQGRHLSVDLVANRFSPKVRAVVDSITLLAGLVMSAIVAWRGFIEAAWDLKFNYTASDIVLVPTYPFWIIYSLGWSLLGVVITTFIIQKVREAIK